MSGRGPVLRRRQIGTLAAGAVAVGALPALRIPSASAADASTFVSGFGLPLNLDPHQVYDVPMQSMMLNAYDNLYRYQGDPPKIVPWLAESHTVSEDGLNWEFKLRPGVKFHDGSPLTAETPSTPGTLRRRSANSCSKRRPAGSANGHSLPRG